jgi:hypothetical protein
MCLPLTTWPLKLVEIVVITGLTLQEEFTAAYFTIKQLPMGLLFTVGPSPLLKLYFTTPRTD